MARALAGLGLLIACSGEAPDATLRPVPVAQADPLAPADDLVVATWSGGQLAYGDVRDDVAIDLRIMEIRAELDRFELLSKTVERQVLEHVLRAEAKKQGVADVETLLSQEIEARVTPPTDAEVEAYYALVASQLAYAPLEQVRPMLVAELSHQAQVERYQAYLDELRAAWQVSLLLPYPDLPRIDVPVGPDDPSRGSDAAPVTVVAFTEYECQYCARVAPTLDQLLVDYPGKVRLVLKDFPLPGHGRAMPAAVATHCAHDQGRYAELGAVLFTHQQALTDGDLVGYAEQIGIDANEFERCMTSGRHEAGIYADMEQGRTAGVTATPSFFINGVFVSGAQPYERFAGIIDRELARTGSP